MPAYTVCPASASSRAASAPKPLDAPLIRMVLPMTNSPWVVVWSDVSSGGIWGAGSDDSAVDADDLAVHPAAGPGEEGDDLGDVGRGAEAAPRVLRGHPGDQVVVLAVQEQRRGGGAGGDRVDGDVPVAQLLGQDPGDGLHGALGRVVRGVGRQLQAHDRGGEVDDRATGAQPAAGLLVDHVGA